MKEKNSSFPHTMHDAKILAPFCALVLTILIVGTTILPLQMLNAQNITIKMNNATSSSSKDNDTISKSVIANLAKPGYGDKYDVSVKGNTVPINYNLLQGQLVGILGDPARHSLDVAVNPGPQGGALEIELPRHTIDSKDSAGNDMPYVVKIDGQRISGEPTGICVGFGDKSCPNIANTFKETQNTNTDRVLTILFGPESRFIEITGNTGI
jgi:hypothetical protein